MIIQGKGKSGKGARAATEEPDSLKSQQFARVIDLVSEGEIEGFVTPNNILKSIYIDDVPIVSPTDVENYEGVKVQAVLGTQNQPYLSDFGEIENEVSVSAKVTKDTPVTRTITNSSIDSVRITVSVPQLFFQNPQTGDIKRTKLQLRIKLQIDGAGFNSVIEDTINGKTSSTYKRSYIVNLRDVSQFNSVEIRVERITNDAPDQSFRNDLFWESYTEIIQSKLSYPNSALVGMSIDSAFFNRIPTRGFHIKGIKIKIPSNYNPITRVYTSDWDGNFKTEWSNNPAWIFYDILTESRYGLGSFIEDCDVDKWVLYEIGKYCDELVRAGLNHSYKVVTGGIITTSPSTITIEPPLYSFKKDQEITFTDGTNTYTAIVHEDVVFSNNYAESLDIQIKTSSGSFTINDTYTGTSKGYEPRFTCNTYIQSREEAYKVLNALSSVFRSIIYWANGRIFTVQDSPDDPVAIFNTSNVKEGAFNYTNSSASVRHNVALVTWNDPNDRFRQKIEYVEDQESIREVGVIETEVLAFGCTSRGQAHRFGKWILYSENQETEIVSFTVGMDSAYVYPGAIIKTNDPFRAGARYGGRILNATSNQITIDAPIDIPINGGKLHYFEPDGKLKSKDVINNTGNVLTSDVLNIHPPIANQDLPKQYSVWVFSEPKLQLQTWRVISVTETENHEVEVTALTHRDDKYAFVEENIELQPLPISNVTLNPVPVDSISTFSEISCLSENQGRTETLISWDSREARFIFEISGPNINDTTEETFINSISFYDLLEGEEYKVKLIPINWLGRRGQATEHQFTVPFIVPNPIQNISASTNIRDYANYVVGTETIVSWQSDAPRFIVELSGPNMNNVIQQTFTPYINFYDLDEGETYKVEITPVNCIGREGQKSEYEFVIPFFDIPPADVTGFRLETVLDTAFLTWDSIDDPNVLGGGYAEIRYTPDKQNPFWNNAIVINRSVSGTTNSTTVPLLTGSYLIKWVTFRGIKSINAQIIKTDAAKVLQFNAFKTIEEHPNFPGQKINFINSGRNLVLSGNNLEGEYYFDDSLVLNEPATVRVLADARLNSYKLINVDTWVTVDEQVRVDGEINENSFGKLEFRSTLDDPLDSQAEWTEWQEIKVGDILTRSLEFRVIARRETLEEQFAITSLTVTIDVPDKIYSGEDVPFIASEGKLHILYPEKFIEKLALSITAQEMNEGDRFLVTNKTIEGFDIEFFDPAGDYTDKTFDWIAKGY